MKDARHLLTWLFILASTLTSAAQTAERNRGVGIYPGNPQEYTGPKMTAGGGERRNLALHRAAYASSTYDYNLTAHLATDGIMVPEGTTLADLPRLSVTTPEGPINRLQREWSVDQTPFSKCVIMGQNTWLQYEMHGYSHATQAVVINGTVAYDENRAHDGYAIRLTAYGPALAEPLTAEDASSELLGDIMQWKVPSDPNKQTEQATLPQRTFCDTIVLSTANVDISRLKIDFCMPGAAYWSIINVELLDGVLPQAATSPYTERTPSRYVNKWFPATLNSSILPAQHFRSAWMSEGCTDEWIYVDLGARSTFDDVKLHWVGTPAEYTLATSDDALTWKPITAWPATGRYVRATMKHSAETAANEPFALSEMEVWGTGGVAAQSTGWTLQREGSEVTIPATVPGTVLSSYINIGAVPDPNVADYVQQISESFFNATFIYRHNLAVPTNLGADEHLWLNFDGINWKAEVFLADEHLGRIEGAFTRARFDIGDIVRRHFAHHAASAPATLPLRVEIIPCAHPGSVKEKTEQRTGFNGGALGADNPTFHATIGWDWITTVRGRDIGIWNDVWLSRSGAVTMGDPYVSTHLDAAGRALVTAEVIVRNHSAAQQQTFLKGTLGDVAFERIVTLEAGDEAVVRFTPEEYPQLAIAQPQLWWPNGYGEPHLYDATFSIGNDTLRYKAGLREMTYSETGDVLKIYVNGRRFVGRGGNWGFSEHNLNFRNREYDIAVRYHRDMNFTMIRNWVGQIGDDEFFDACDRYGIMVWQDFWLANPADGPEPADEAMFMANAEDFALKLRRHPSIGIWCGRNEGYPKQSLDKALRRLVKDVTPGIHYIGSSADDVVSGRGPYRALPAKEYFAMTKGSDRLHSERGMPCVMNPESSLRAFGNAENMESHQMWGMHDFTREGAQRGTTFVELLENALGHPESADEFCRRAQWVNYEGYRALYESRSRERKGLILWMTHACWPSMVWQTYDYYFDPTGALFGAKKACEPLHIQYNAASDSIEVVNYSGGDHKRLEASITLRRLDGSEICRRRVKLDSPEDTTTPLLLPAHDAIEGPYILDLALTTSKRQLISENRYVMQPDSTLLSKGQANLAIEETEPGTVRITNRGTKPAFLVRLQLLNADGTQVLPIFWNDNYFHLLPGESRTINYDYNPADTDGSKPHVSAAAL